MTKKEMHDQVVRWLGLQEVTDYDEGAIVDGLLYQGTIDLLARTKCVARCLELRLLAGEDVYTLDHKVLALVDVEDGHRRRARRDQDVEWADGWIGTVVLPAGSTPASLSGRTFTMIRSDLLRVNPAPSEDGELQCWAVLRPSKMALDTDSVSMEAFGAIPDEYQDAIVTYALWKAADYSDDASSQQSERYRILYEGQDGRGGRLMQIRSSVNRRGSARAPARRVRLRGVNARRTWVG